VPAAGGNWGRPLVIAAGMPVLSCRPREFGGRRWGRLRARSRTDVRGKFLEIGGYFGGQGRIQDFLRLGKDGFRLAVSGFRMGLSKGGMHFVFPPYI
jgi:hypothetical protein